MLLEMKNVSKEFDGVRVEAAAGGTEVTYTLPACSVAVLRFEA